jgi:methylenetetrahydrofolate reductase (NADPH)
MCRPQTGRWGCIHSLSAIRQVGIEWCIAQSQELIKNSVPFLHYYSMGKSDNIHKVARAVF